jgi:hypothetical protein
MKITNYFLKKGKENNMANEIDFTQLGKQEEKKVETFALSNQAMGALMMALQKSLMELSDITLELRNWQFQNTSDGLIVLNPPIVKTPPSTDELTDEEATEE